MRAHHHHRAVLPILLVSAALSGCDPVLDPEPALAGPPDPSVTLLARGAFGKDMVPLTVREKIEAAEDAVPIACEGGLQVDKNHWTGSATLTHLGQSAVDVRIESCRTELVPIGEMIHLWTATITNVYTAANGDELRVTGELRSYEPTRIEVDVWITGGTGRFAGATGSASGEGSRAIDAYVAYDELNGVISRPNSLR